MAVPGYAVDIAFTGKRLVGLVQHHQAALQAHGGDDFFDDRVVPQIGRRVVRVGQVGDGRLVFSNSRQHGGFVELKVGGQIDAYELQALQLRAHRVHHKTRQRREDRGGQPAAADSVTRHIASHGQQRNQLVRAIAQHDVKALGHRSVAGQRSAQVIDPAIGITVQRQRTEALTERGLQSGGQAVRIFHRVELDHAAGRLDGVGVHGLDVLPDQFFEFWVKDGHWLIRMAGTSCKRISAARAWACRPSP